MAKQGIYGTIEGVGRLAKRLQRSGKKFHRGRVVVGYETPYAIYVHEDVEMNHPKGGQDHFLSEPAEFHKKDIRDYIRMRLKKGATLRQALLDAGRILLRVSKKLVPVDTRKLQNSRFAKFEET